jgi:2-polyprenyl-3-methyl-5-hydroxy-6-metoxy-1,4-benzoquinol methylase
MSFAVSRCRRCGFLFTNPRLTQEALSEYYADAGPYAVASYHRLDAVRPRYEGFLDELGRHGVGGGRMLEIGCDKGQFLAIARERGFVVEGVEPSAGADMAARLFGLPVRRCRLEAVELEPAAYDGIAMLDVIEHMHRPLDCLAMVARALAPRGLLLLKTPNVRHEHGLYPLLRGRAALRFGAHEHLNHFTQATLVRALEAGGLQVVDWLGVAPLAGGRVGVALGRAASLLAGLVRSWQCWPDHHVSLVCLARRGLASPAAAALETEGLP